VRLPVPAQQTGARTVPITQIILDEEIYPRSGVYPKRVSMFAEIIRDGFKIDPIEVQIHPEYDDKYRILDGAHRWNAYREIGATEIAVHFNQRLPSAFSSKRLTGDSYFSDATLFRTFQGKCSIRHAKKENSRCNQFRGV
jgi:hypothetical protein